MTETVSFWTNGDNFTNLLRDLWSSLEANKVIEIIKDGKINERS